MTKRLGLECSDCGKIVFTIHDARVHERVADPGDDEVHGGWDTVEVDVE